MESKKTSLKTRSYASHSSKSSSHSAIGAAAANARAKAEAAKARLKYAGKEMEIKLEKAKLEATMEVLVLEKESAAAEAEAAALEAAALEAAVETSDIHSAELQLEEPPLDPAERTKGYVTEQATQLEIGQSEQRMEQFSTNEVPQFHKELAPLSSNEVVHFKQEDSLRNSDLRQEHSNTNNAQQQCADTTMPSFRDVGDAHYLSTPQAFSSAPLVSLERKHTPHQQDHNISDFVRYFARRELVTTGLVHFNDRPDGYRAWKRSFQNTVRDLDLTSSEELDLLVKWLGRESSEHAKRIRSVNINQPDRGLRMVWTRLDQCYGAPEVIESSLFYRIDNFPKISNRDYPKLHELSDLLMELEAAMVDGELTGLSCLNTARGIQPIVQKLPFCLQEKWLSVGSSYKKQHKVSFPPFEVFAEFVSEQAQVRNDPSFKLPGLVESPAKQDKVTWKSNRKEISVHKTDVSQQGKLSFEEASKKTPNSNNLCPIHKKPHLLSKCRTFREMSLPERRAFLKDKGICFKCCTSALHMAKDCKSTQTCSECESNKHVSALHPGPAPWNIEKRPLSEYGGEEDPMPPLEVTAKSTEVDSETNRSCSKICLVKVYPTGCSDRALNVYAIIDEQSNRSLARSEFFDVFDIQGPNTPYSLRTCSGVTETLGRKASGFLIESLDKNVCLPLPNLLECNDIPDNRQEIPTSSVAISHPHLKSIAHLIPEPDPKASIMLLLGRDIIQVHKVRKQINGPNDAPYGQKLDLGWVVVGNSCLGSVHKPVTVDVLFTRTFKREHSSIFEPCPNVFHVKERFMESSDHTSKSSSRNITCNVRDEQIGVTLFEQTRNDNMMALSIDDISFLKILERGLNKDNENNWVAPLPFKACRSRLPDNRTQAQNRLLSLKRNLERKPVMRQHFLSFMDALFLNNHAEVAPALNKDEERWYLPIFGVYHPRKPGNIRVVFDSSAKYNGVSLNDVLLSGPDLNNSLLGVLIRFRKEAVAIAADIQQMFYCFLVPEEDRNFLRFLWFQDNDLSKDITEYRMRVHVFGNSPSPAVAIYCLRQSVKNCEPDVKQFVNRDFYVDDGMKSLPTVDAAVSLLKRTQASLSDANLRLHKIASNKKEVLEAFPTQDYANDLKDLDFTHDELPKQRSLGLMWDLKCDSFTFEVTNQGKPLTRRGVLSTLNSIFDPLGFLAPVIIQGKAILRELTQLTSDWDAKIPPKLEETWNSWLSSLKELNSILIPRTYAEISPLEASKRQLCIFTDASTKAVAAVAYLKLIAADGTSHVGFVIGKAKLAPLPEHTVPRLELCAAVLGVELGELISLEMDLQIDETLFFTDSKVVLGYICNETRRFYVYVSNRVTKIRKLSKPGQWQYVPSEVNPADIATRFISAHHLLSTSWLSGPSFLKQPCQQSSDQSTHELVDPLTDAEIRPQVTTLATTSSDNRLGSQRFSKFSSWKSVTHAIARLVHIARLFRNSQSASTSGCKGWHHCQMLLKVEELLNSEKIIIRSVQKETFAEEYSCLKKQGTCPKNSPLKALSPFIDCDDLLRVGGRIMEADVSQQVRTPVIIPGKHHVATLLIRHHHEKVQHQGRHFTEGAIRVAGLWIVGGKRKISRVIHECVICRKLRGKVVTQKMADLPSDRLSTEPPFTNVGLDVFGPWTVSSRRTRGGLAQSKRWAVMFTCLSIRAIHIEVIESLETSSFINALRRFFAIRGPVKLIRSDRGTNFIGACKELKIPSNIDNTSVENFLVDHGCTWKFNPPHAPHMGGSWERMIGITKKILDSMFLQSGTSKLSHETLTTLLAEVMAIVNARPLIPVSSDPDDSLILSPAMLLTQKVNLPSTPAGDWVKDIHKCQWQQVQHLAQMFWDKWRKQYLSYLQPRRKWQSSQPDLASGSVVLLADTRLRRHEWPLGLVTQVFPSGDGKVRTVEVQVARADGTKVFTRPVSELVLLLEPDKSES